MSFADAAMPWPNRAANRWGHWGARVLISSILAAVALVLRPLAYDNPFAIVAPLSLIVLVLISWLMMRQHDRRLCETCMASMPLNTSELAGRYRLRFRIAHLGSNKKFVVGYLLVLLASNFVFLSAHLVPEMIGRYLWAAVQLTMIYLVMSAATHRRLQPWCPECSGGGGAGDDVHTPDPVPTGAGRF